jgi:metal-responsive CopG/Arc/MetJ family transcriptional regulator
MGRKKKYESPVEVVSLCIPKNILALIDYEVFQTGKSRQDIINWIIRDYVESKEEYCVRMAKKSAQDLHYWRSRAEMIKEQKR